MGGKFIRRPHRVAFTLTAVLATGAWATVAPGGSAARTAARSEARAARTVGNTPTCLAGKRHARQAARIERAIGAALRSRFTSRDPDYDPFANVSVQAHDGSLGLNCWYRVDHKFYSASAVKATILAALLLKAQDQHRRLTSKEQREAWRMITESDNDAATALWSDVGLPGLQHFLNVARMRQTVLNTWGAWGLTEITAHDETILLRLLMTRGKVLTDASRHYELYLMNNVIPGEAWGVRAGSPKYFSWHIKNGWAPLPDPASSRWVVNSIGCFLYKSSGYTLVVLTHDNPGADPDYGIATIEAVAWVINRGLHPDARSVWPQALPSPAWRIPDEVLPDRPAGH